ncbi:hypothetical protein ES702_02173 [subsurface metagenome]
MIPGKKYNPGTFTSRRPTPEKFEHLRKWIDVDEKFLDITTIDDLKDINVQLEQSSKLFVSNVISRVIAQLLGAYGDGFVTLEATAEGYLKIEDMSHARTIKSAVIDFATATTHVIVAAVADKKIRVTNLMFTVGGELNITLYRGSTPLSGAMDFGADGEPRGMVQHFGCCPMETAVNEAFRIKLSEAIQVSGYVTYFEE